MKHVVAKNIDGVSNSRTFLDGSDRVVAALESVAVGRGKYLPGWKWSERARPQTGLDSASHVGYILEGRMVIQGADGQEVLIGPADAFEAQPGHDACVVGDEPCIALDFSHFENCNDR